MHLIILLLVTLASIFVIDLIWLALIAKNLYLQNFGMLLRKSGDSIAPIAWSGGLVYICLSVGILIFVIPKAQGNLLLALVYGALFGLVTYGIYEFTNYSLLAHWPLNMTFIDWIWGAILCALTSFIVVFIQNRFFS